MSSIINADTSNGLKLTSDTSGEIKLQSAGTDIATVNSSGITMASGKVLAPTGPAFRAGSNATQAITVNTWTKVTFGAEFTDTNSNFASSRFTPTVAGYYFITSRVGEGLTTTGDPVLYIAIYKNGLPEVKNQSTASSGWYTNVDISGLVYCNGSTDYIEIYFYTSSNNSYTLSASSVTNYFHGFLARAE